MKLLEILSYLGKDDEDKSNDMYKIIEDTIKRAENSGNIGHALVYQCLLAILKIHPNDNLLEHVSRSITWFFSSDSRNLNYIGIIGLTELVKKDQKFAAMHQ
jgi:AP-4 complex subunit epsilon-1